MKLATRKLSQSHHQQQLKCVTHTPLPRLTNHMMLFAVEVGRPEDSAPVMGVIIVWQWQTSVGEQIPRLKPRTHQCIAKYLGCRSRFITYSHMNEE